MIRTARLVLRALRLEDADALHEAMGDPEVMRYWSTPAHASIEQTRAWVARGLTGAIELAVEHEGDVIGRVGFWRPEEVGFLFLRRVWGKGFAREAIAASVDHAFASTDWPEIRADVDPRNEASLRVLARVGFSVSGRAARTYCIDGEWVDSVYLSRERPLSHFGGRGGDA